MDVEVAEHTKEEIAWLGKEIYQRDIRPKIEAGNNGKVVAIDVRTGEYELGDNALLSATGLRRRLPNALIWFERVGYPTYITLRSPR